MTGLLRFAAVLSWLTFAVPATPQSVYVDLDIYFGDPQIGNGAPSPQFGGAANQPGYWNRVHLSSPGPDVLLDTAGRPTSVVMRASGGIGTGIGFRFEGNTGDYALLLNDAANIGGEGTNVYRFDGLARGIYRIVTYAVAPYGAVSPVAVTVPGSWSPNPQVVTGPMPGNSLQYLVTHSVHELSVQSGLVEIRASGPWPTSYVNGMQLVLVPEARTFAATGMLLFIVLIRKKSKE